MSDIEQEVLEESGAEGSGGQEAEDPGESSEFGEEEADDSARSVASSMVSAWAYNRGDQQIEVTFNSGQTMSYDCSPEQWDEAKNAVSPGKFVHENFL